MRSLAALVLSLAFLAACGEGEAPDPPPDETTPEATLASLKRAAADRDYDAMYELLSAAGRESITEGGLEAMKRIDQPVELRNELQSMTPGEFLERMAEMSPESGRDLDDFAAAKLAGKPRPEGGSCVLTLETAGGWRYDIRLVREAGLWKLADIGQLSLSHRHQAACLTNLFHLAGHMRARLASLKLANESGSAFLLQLAPKVKDEWVKIFVCPGDRGVVGTEVGTPDFVERYRAGWRSAPCSYRGPSAEFLAAAVRGEAPERYILACDKNGADGRAPHHASGVCVLWNDSKVQFLRWEEMEGHEGGPVQVGPGSPDPRFRHLIE
ncbi:MAG: hypothetical protein ACYS99_04715 [Planctomycetota bacterium]